MKRQAGLGIHGIGRLKPGVTLAQAKADMDRVTRNLTQAYPEADKHLSTSFVPLKEQMVGGVRPYLLVLLGAVGFVLLIACVNVANLLLARSSGRAREFAIRAALGASQGQVIRQLLAESVLLALAGGGLGLLLAAWGTQAALHLAPRALPRVEDVGLDLRVLTFYPGGVAAGRYPLRTRPRLQGVARRPSPNAAGRGTGDQRRAPPCPRGSGGG